MTLIEFERGDHIGRGFLIRYVAWHILFEFLILEADLGTLIRLFLLHD